MSIIDKVLNTDNDSVDYDFYDNNGDTIKVYDPNKQSNSSKIVTKAIIETKPFDILEKTCSKISTGIDYNKIETDDRRFKSNEYLSSSSSSLDSPRENVIGVLDESLMNCLAYNDADRKDQHITSFLQDDREFSDNSLSDSTISALTSDLTSVSPFSSISEGSLSSESEENIDSLSSHSKTNNGNENNTNISNMGEISRPNVRRLSNENAKEQKRETRDPVVDEISNMPENVRSIFGTSIEPEKCSYLTEEDETSKGSDHNSQLEKESDASEFTDEGDISICQSSTSSKLCVMRTPSFRGANKFRMKKKECNLTFSREELIKIERDNLILLKKIMVHSKPKTVSLNHPFCHKKTSAAINRARQQKKIEQDNYILYSKISALSRMKKVF